MIPELNFNWKYKNYELRACPKSLVSLNDNEKNVTISFIKWTSIENNINHPYPYILAYYQFTKNGYKLKWLKDINKIIDNMDRECRYQCFYGLFKATLSLDDFFRKNYQMDKLKSLTDYYNGCD